MTQEILISILIAWNVLGGILCTIIASKSCADGWELCNPY